MFYRNLFQETWLVVWRRKYLWWLGLFASLLGVSIEADLVYNFLVRQSEAQVFWNHFFATYIGVFSNLREIMAASPRVLLGLLLVLLVTLIMFGLILMVAAAAQVAIVDNFAGEAQNTAKNSLIPVKKNFFVYWARGLRQAWPVMILNFMIRLASYLSFLAISVWFLSDAWFSEALVILGVLLSSLLVLLVLILAFAVRYMIAFLVVKKLSFGQSVIQGWLLFKNNWLISIETSVIIFLVNIGGAVLVLVAATSMAVPAVALGILFQLIFKAPLLLIIMLGLGFCCWLVGVVLGGAWLSSLVIGLWTNLFLKLTVKNNKVESKFVRQYHDWRS